MNTCRKNAEKKNWGWTLRRGVAMLLVLVECFSLMAVGVPTAYAENDSMRLDADTQLTDILQSGELSASEGDPTGETPAEPEFASAMEAAEAAEDAAAKAEESAQRAEEAKAAAEEAEELDEVAAAAEQSRTAAGWADLAAERAQLAADFAAEEAEWTAEAAEEAAEEARQAEEELERGYREAALAAETTGAHANSEHENKAEDNGTPREKPERKTGDVVDGLNRNGADKNEEVLAALEEAIEKAERTKEAEEYALAVASEAAEAYERAMIAADAAAAAAERANEAADSASEIEAAKAAEAEQNTDGDEIDGDEIKGDEIDGDEIDGDEIKGDEIDGDEIKGDEIKGDEIKGDEIDGDEIKGDEIKGDEIKGDEIDGDETKGDETKGEEKAADDPITEEKEEASGETLIYSDSAVSLTGEAPAELVVETTDVSADYEDFDPSAFFTGFRLKAPLPMGDRSVSRRTTETKYSVLAAYDISLTVEGEEYQPDADSPLTVSISNPAIKEDLTLQVWHIYDDGTGTQIHDFTVEGDSVTFLADSFSAYLVVKVTVVTYITAGDGNTYRVSVTYDQDAEMPENADLAVRELDDDEKKSYVNQSAETLETDAENFLFARAFDISLIDPDTGDKLQPAGSVKVSISLLDTDVGEADELNLLHFGDEVETVGYTLNDGTVEFETDGFSVYVITGQNRWLWVFTYKVWNDALETYMDFGGMQRVKNGEKPIIPQPASDDYHEFDGWYEGTDNESGDIVLDDEPFDFDAFAETPFTEDGSTTLYAKFTDYVYVIFHDQDDSDDGVSPVAFTRREPLTEVIENGQRYLTAQITIDDLSATYTGSSSMAFRGWSYTQVETGVYKDPDTDVSYVIPGPTITAKYPKAAENPDEPAEYVIHLYPIYKTIHWLTYYSAQSGSGASYVPPQRIFEGDGIPGPLETSSREGYTFRGWRTGSMVITTEGAEEITYGSLVSGPDGKLFRENGTPYLDEPSGGVSISYGELRLSADATLFADWEKNSSTYSIVIWKQKPTDAPGIPDGQKSYDFALAFKLNAGTGETVAVPDEYKNMGVDPADPDKIPQHGFEYYKYSRCDDPKKIDDSQGVTRLNVYYDFYDPNGSYVEPTDDVFTLHFAGEGEQPADIQNIPFGTPLANYLADMADYQAGFNFYMPADRKSENDRVIENGRWYMDEARTVSANLDTMTMPDRDLTLYAGHEAEWFIVKIDPNYGALYYYDGGELKGTGNTWFWQTYDSEPIGEYTHVVRDYVPSGSGSYYYVNRNREYYGYMDNAYYSGEPRERQTFYTPNLAEATEDATFEYAPGAYSYDGWYEVFEDGTEAEEPYDFTQHTDHHTTLKLHWKRTGMFYLAFDAGSGRLEDGLTKKDDVAQLTDVYADNADVVLNRMANAPSGYYFVGWRQKDGGDGRVYAPGEIFTLRGDDANRESGRDVVWMEAVYDRVHTVTVVYHPNGGTFDPSEFDYGIVPSMTESGSATPAAGQVKDDGNAWVTTDLANNARYILSSGAGLSRNGTTFVGWCNKPVYNPDDPEAELYTYADENSQAITYGVDDTDGSVTDLYAVWSTKVTYHLNSSDALWGDGWADAGYKQDTVNDPWYKTIYVGNIETEPDIIPQYTGSDRKMFYFWTTVADDNSKEYDFSQPVEGALDFYAFWAGEIEVPVHCLDASEEELRELPISAISAISVLDTEVGLLDGLGEANPADYRYAFAVVLPHDAAPDRDNVLEEDAIKSVYYNQNEKYLYVKYGDGRPDAVLNKTDDIFFVYYRLKELPVGYKTMPTSGELVEVDAQNISSAAPSSIGETPQGEYDMATQLSQPKAWAGNSYACFAYAVGRENATNASHLQLITNSRASDDDRPTVRLRNTWHGFELTMDSGDNAVWNDCGYNPALYVIYYEQKPTVIQFSELTVGPKAEMETVFVYQLQVTEYAAYVQKQIKVGEDNWEDDGGELPEITVTLFDSHNEGSSPYELKSGENYHAPLFCGEGRGQYIYENDNVRYVTTRDESVAQQTFTLTQEQQTRFTTALSIDGAAQTESPAPYTFTFTADGTTESVAARFTNTLAEIPVELHVALVDVKDGNVKLGDTYRGDNHSFTLTLGESGSFLDKISDNDLCSWPTELDGAYALGAVVYGTHDTNGTVTLGDTELTTIRYGQVDGNRYELLLDGDVNHRLGENEQIYYLYYPIPQIRYMKKTGTALTEVTGSFDGENPSPSITYNRETLRMNNNREVIQGQRLYIPLDGNCVISQTGNHFRMPANLDDGVFARYLTYSQLGVGAENAHDTAQIVFGSGRTLILRVQEGALQYSFTGEDNDWHSFTVSAGQTPTVYAIYEERGYDLKITKTVDTSASGRDPIFTGATFTLTISSDAIKEGPYDVEGYAEAQIIPTLSEEGKYEIILPEVADGMSVRILGLGQGEYTVTEGKNENYELHAKKGPIVGGTGETVTTIIEDRIIPLTLNSETMLEITNTPRRLCKIVDGGVEHIFYTFADALEYVDDYISDYTAEIEMLSDYLMPAEDAAEIPAGFHITLKTATTGDKIYSGNSSSGKAVITRSEEMAGIPLFENNGDLTLENVILDGAGIESTAALIHGTIIGTSLTVGEGAMLLHAVNTGNGGAIYAEAGNITVEGGVIGDEDNDDDVDTGNRAARGGAIYYTGSGTISLTSGALLNGNSVAGDGGAIYASRGSIEMSGMATVSNNAAGGNGGAIYAGSVTVVIDENASVASNSAKKGGAIYVAETLNLTVQKTAGVYAPTITGNRATDGDGGAIYANKGTITVTDGSFSSNRAANGHGGAIYAQSASVDVSQNASFALNTAFSGGAIYAASNNRVSVTGGSFSSNSAVKGADNTTGHGGAIYADSGEVTLSGVSLSGNTASNGKGGAVYAGGAVSVDGVTGASNNSAENGGLIYADTGAVTVTNATLSSNSASQNGGLIYANKGNVTLTLTGDGNGLSNNTATSGSGGAVYAKEGSVSLTGGALTGNTAANGSGGAIYAGGGVSVDSVTSASNNSAKNGGLIYADTGAVTVTNSSLSANRAGENGGLIYANKGNVTLTLTGDGNGLSNNTATSGSGGAVYAEEGSVSLTGGALTGNRATNGKGGAIYAGGGVSVDSVTSASNNSAKNGGLIYADAGAVTVTNARLSENIAGENGGLIYANKGNVTLMLTEDGNGLSANTAAANGGAVYAVEGAVSVSGGTLTGNTATNGKGGVICALGGAVTLNGASVTENTSSGDGGVIYAGARSVTVSGCAGVKGNKSTGGNGGVICADEGAVTVSDCTFGDTDKGTDQDDNVDNGNSAKNGGVIYAKEGAVTVATSAMTGNTASDSGGAIYAGSGNVSMTMTGDGYILRNNTASKNGGAVYTNTGAVSLTDGSVTGNTATNGNGGAVYAGGGISLTNTPMSGNTAANGNGGAFCSASGSVNVTGTGAISGNSAKNGGAFYMDAGTATLSADFTARENNTSNGSAIFTKDGSIYFNGCTVTANTSTNGGGVGTGSVTARLYLSGAVQITGNKRTVDGSEPENANIYLDQDTQDIINISGIDAAARIGVYVPDELTNKRDVPGARFAVYTSDTNVSDTTIKNDHTRFEFKVGKDTSGKKLYWAKNIYVRVTYLASYSNGLPNGGNSGANAGTEVKGKTSYCPIIGEDSTVSLSELANDFYNKNTGMVGTGAGKLPSSAVFGGAFAWDKNASDYGKDVTALVWDSANAQWKLNHRDGSTPYVLPSSDSIILVYTEPAYISIENNTENTLTVSELSISATAFTDQPVINDPPQAGYGTLYAKNGAIRSALLPITAEDLTLAEGESVLLLIPGGQGMRYKLNGSYDTNAEPSILLRRGTSDPLPEETLKLSADGSFYKIIDASDPSVESDPPLEGTLSGTYEIIFGNDKKICKVMYNGEEKTFSKISDALTFIVSKQLKGTKDNPTAIEMLTDYLLRASDPVSIPQEYNIKLTTAVDGEYYYEYYPYEYDATQYQDEKAYKADYEANHPRATISRDAENVDALILASYTDANKYTSLTIEHLIFDGKGIKGNTKGGAIQTNNCQLTVRYVDVKNIYAENGGGIYAEGHRGKAHSIVTVENCNFTDCHSTYPNGRNGGGAIHAYTRELYVYDSDFDACVGEWQAGAVFHRIDDGDKNTSYNGKKSTSVVERCTFTNCTAKAAGGLELDSVDITVEDCEFRHCIGTVRNGGGFNIYVANNEEPTFDCSTTVRNCTFDDCRITTNETSETRGNGGGFRCNSKTITMENCSFTNTIARNGGAVCFKNQNATATISGCTITGCTAVNYGGGVYSNAASLTIGDYTYTDDEGKTKTVHTSITNCTSTNDGGGVNYTKYNGTLSSGTLTMTNVEISNGATSKTGGGVCTTAKTVTITGGSISNSTAVNQGGGIYHNRNATNSTFTMNGTAVDGNTCTNSSNGKGGGVNTTAYIVTITGGSISNNKSAHDGAGLYTNAQTSLTIKGTTISGNESASKSGGGVWYDGANDAAREGMTLDIQGCTIDRNSANYGGGVYTLAKTVSIGDYSYGDIDGSTKTLHTSISNNIGKNYGGGLYHSREVDGSTLTITNASIDGNRITVSSKVGGGVYTNARTLSITGGSISNNTATGSGGGLWYDSTAGSMDNRALMILAVSDCAIDGNTSGGSGGGIFTQAKTVTLGKEGDTKMSVSNNTATNYGGGLYQNVEFSINKVIYGLADTTLTLKNAAVNGNTATSQDGGGVYTNVRTLSIAGGSISNNHADTSGKNGGGLWYDSTNNVGFDAADLSKWKRDQMVLSVSDCVIDGNTTGGSGGGVYTQVKTVTLGKEGDTKMSVSNNTAANYGGGLYHNVEFSINKVIYGLEDTVLTLKNAAVNDNKANSQYGGGVYTNARTMTVTDGSISNNTAARDGGGLWFDSTNNVGFSEDNLSQWKRDQMALSVSDCAIDGNTSGGSGGGVYTQAKTVTLGQEGNTKMSVSNNTAAGNGGGVYHNASFKSGDYYFGYTNPVFTITDALVNGNKANNGSGGGVLTNAETVTLVGATVSNNTASSTSSNQGGGLYANNWNQNAAGEYLYPELSLTVRGCTFSGNACSNGSGGGVSTNAKTLTVEGRDVGGNTVQTAFSDCSASMNGGGIYHNRWLADSATLLTGCTVRDCRASGSSDNNRSGGGGVFSNAGALTITGAVISGNTAVGSGGGVLYDYNKTYSSTNPDANGLTLDGCELTGNEASIGGGVYTRCFARLRNASSITGNRLSTGIAENAAGMYMLDSMTLIVGVLDAQEDELYIRGNYTDAGLPSNLRLWSHTGSGTYDTGVAYTAGQNHRSSVQINCPLTGEIRVVNANRAGTQFGSWEASVEVDPTGFLLDESDAVFKADYDTIYGGINRADLSRKQVIWVGPAVCKITDGAGNLLFLKTAEETAADGTITHKGTDYAIFDKLDDSNPDGSITSAFNLLRGEKSLTDSYGNPFIGPELYNADGTLYTGDSYCVKMLDSFTTESPIRINYHEGRSYTLTTAGRNDTDGFPYEYNKTVKTRGDTATVSRGAGVGNVSLLDAQSNLTVENIILDGGSNNGIAAGSDTRILNVGSENRAVTVMLRDGAMLQNAATTGNGGAVRVNSGTLVIGDDDNVLTPTLGAIRNCRAADGAGVYADVNASVTFNRGNIIQCFASNNGGGVCMAGASGSGSGEFWMNGGSIERCTADNAGGVYVGNNRSFHMAGTNCRIAGNKAVLKGGGVAVGGSDARLYFSKKPIITGNTCDASVELNKKCNVELDYPSVMIINTADAGLYNGANIGVYVPGTEGTNSVYDNHGVERRPFGSYPNEPGTNTNTKTFYCFVNDRNGLKGGLIAGTGDNLIYWVKIFSLEVSKKGNDIPRTETFEFEVLLWGTATVAGQLQPNEIEGDFGGMFFTVQPDGSTKATFTLALGEEDSWETGVSCTGENLSFGLNYRVTEKLTSDQEKTYAALPAMYKGVIGENNTESVNVAENERYISRAPFENVRAVCKITDQYDRLLYYAYEYKGATGEVKTTYVPAVYTSLQAAMDALDDRLLTGKDFTQYMLDANDGVKIQMLVGSYTLTAPITIPDKVTLKEGAAITLTTASRDESETDKYVYRGDQGTVAEIKRGYAGDSMFTASKPLTLTGITIDGEKNAYPSSGNGAIVTVPDGGKLTIASRATLQKSASDGKGGAVYVRSGGSLVMTGGMIQTSTAEYGGAAYVESGGTMAMNGGTIQNNSVTDSGAGVYLEAGSRMELSDSPSFGQSTDSYGTINRNGSNLARTLAVMSNGGKNYTREHQDIYLAEDGDDNALVLTGNLTGSPGSIWIWADSQKRYSMGSPFAKLEFTGTEDVTDETYWIFRNAQIDYLTRAGSDNQYLTGDETREKDGFIHWTGGFDVRFMKTDSYGNVLGGAKFTLYKSFAYDNMEKRITLSNEAGYEVKSADGNSDRDAAGNILPLGTVLFEKVPAGVYYMIETESPAGYVNSYRKDANGKNVANVYIVLVGDSTLKKDGLTDADPAKNCLQDITGASQNNESNTVVDTQVKLYQKAFEDYGTFNQYAIFLIDSASGKAVATPNIARYGVMNISKAERKVLLRKVAASGYEALSGAVFQIERYDRTLVSGTDVNEDTTTSFTSGDSGVYFIDKLPYGRYYLHEITLPSGAQQVTEGNDGNWFILTVSENGVGYEQAANTFSNTLSPAATKPN